VHDVTKLLLVGLPAPRRIALGLMPHQRFGADLRVLGQRPDRRMTGSPHEHQCPGSGLGVVRQRGVPELVQASAPEAFANSASAC
jgi:hypothetical protein